MGGDGVGGRWSGRGSVKRWSGRRWPWEMKRIEEWRGSRD